MAEFSGKRLAGYVPDYVVFDLETTGISIYKDEIIEISAVRVRGGEVKETFSTLVNPGRNIPYQASMVNGITDEMVRDEPPLSVVFPEFLRFIGTDVLVGHNIHSFDLKFIQSAMESLYQQSIKNDYIDTLYMARRCLPQLSHYKLVDLAKHYHISAAGAHRALNDCIMNQKCFEAMGKEPEHLAAATTESCPRCGGELKKRNGKFGMFWGCGNFPGCRYTRNA